MEISFDSQGPFFSKGKVSPIAEKSSKDDRTKAIIKSIPGAEKGNPKKTKFNLEIEEIFKEEELPYPLNPKSVVQLYKSYEDVNRSNKVLTGHVSNVDSDTVYILFHRMTPQGLQGKIVPVPIDSITYKTHKTYKSKNLSKDGNELQGKIYQFYFKEPETFFEIYRLKKPY